jgi:hypothetical protein
MIRLITLMIIVIIIAIGAEYIITESFSESIRVTVSDKYTDGDIYVIKTISLQTLGTNRDIYNKIEVGKTYNVKIFMGQIKEVSDI